jgi:N-acetylglucosaminyldiphosphoundecaprenol N-acetyl-beta-D-mannosaminyltransferase
MPKFEQILGIRFFNGTASEAVEHVNHIRGYAVAPAAPALANILRDAGYLCALSKADVAIADSGFMVLLWRLLRGRKLRRISGLRYLQTLLDNSALRESGRTFFILPSAKAREKAVCWLCSQGFDISERDCYIAPIYPVGQAFLPAELISTGKRERLPYISDLPSSISHPASTAGSPGIEDPKLVSILESHKPAHIIVGIGGGIQEKLGFYLREHLSYRPAIHCIGAALAFLTGDQKPIPMWADRIYLGWFLRLARAPHRYGRRFAPAFRLPGMILRYGKDLPPVRWNNAKCGSRNAE